jgi:hypothetical protein
MQYAHILRRQNARTIQSAKPVLKTNRCMKGSVEHFSRLDVLVQSEARVGNPIETAQLRRLMRASRELDIV